MYQSTKGLSPILQATLQHKHFIPVCFVVAFIIRLGWIYFVPAQPVSDFRWYYERGLDLAAGKGYSVGAGAYWPENIPPRILGAEDDDSSLRSPTAYWPVGYPAFLGLLFAMFGPSLFIAKLANVILYLGVLFLSYHIGKSIFASELTGRVSLLLLSFYPDHIAYSSLLASEILFLFLLLGGIALLIVPKQRLWLRLTAGLIFGLACLVKPQVIFIPALFFTIMLISANKRKALREYLTGVVAVYIALGITIWPWLIRNYNIFGAFVLSNNGGYNLLVGNKPGATGAYIFNEQIASLLSQAQNERDRDQKAVELAVEYIVSHPWETIKLWPKKLWYLYRDDTKGIIWNERGLDGTGQAILPVLKALAQLYYMFMGATFLLSVFILIREQKIGRQSLVTLGLWIVLYFTMIALVTFGNSRFHFVMIPWLTMYVGALVEALLRPEYQILTLASSAARRFKWS